MPSRMVGVSASVNLPLHHKVQKFSSGTGSPGWPRKKGRKTVVVVVRGSLRYSYHGDIPISGTDDAAGGVLSARSNSSTKNAMNTLIPGKVHNTIYSRFTEINRKTLYFIICSLFSRSLRRKQYQPGLQPLRC